MGLDRGHDGPSGLQQQPLFFFKQCAFFRARNNQGADVIVANHDLVLADLAQEEGGAAGTRRLYLRL